MLSYIYFYGILFFQQLNCCHYFQAIKNIIFSGFKHFFKRYSYSIQRLMLDWLFGSSKGKEEKKQTSNHEALKEEDAWAYDFIKQYFISPLWRNPLINFIEENCLIFEDSEENKFEYTKIFKEFVGLCEILIESILIDTGISEKVLAQCIAKGLSHKKDAKIFKQLLVCDNFLSFKSIMVAKNKQMEVQALRELGGAAAEIQIDEKELERLEIEKAIAMSLAMEEKLKEQEDLELQEAIRVSQIESQKMEEKEEKKQEKNYLGDLPPLMVRNNQMNKTMQQWKEDEQKVTKQIQALKIADKKKEEQESAEQRKKRLMEQRQLIKKKKADERQKELDAFVQNKPIGDKPQQVTEEELERRRKVMQRLKEQLKD